MLSMGQAARETGVSKATIHRAIKSGRLSALRQDDGSYQIDPAELFRVYGAAKPVQVVDVRQDATPMQPPPPSLVHELQARVALLELELSSEKRRAEVAETDRNRWHAQAERLALPAPAKAGLLARLFGRAA